MTKPMLALCLLLVSSAASGNYIEDRRRAEEIFKAKEYEKALDAFVSAAEAAPLPAQKADGLTQAALCALQMEEPEKAMDLAEQIPVEPESKALQIRVLIKTRKHSEIVEKFGDEAIGQWPDKVAGPAFWSRGNAYRQVGDYEKAAADFTAAVADFADPSMRAQAAFALGELYRDQLNGPDKALDAYLVAVKAARKHDRWGWLYFSSTMSAARILGEQERHGEALRLIEQVEPDKLGNAYWRVTMLMAWGDALAAAGKTEDAVEKYTQALGTKGITPAQKETCEKRIKTIPDGLDQ